MAMGRCQAIMTRRHWDTTTIEAMDIPLEPHQHPTCFQHSGIWLPIWRATDEVHDEAYHIDVNNTADEMHQRFRKSFNCGINGHLWQDYKEPLKESLRNALKAANAWLAWEKDQLNKTGGTGMKGGCIPKAGEMAKAPLAQAKAWETPEKQRCMQPLVRTRECRTGTNQWGTSYGTDRQRCLDEHGNIGIC